MVGVPRSSGCRICVQRRVRCDGARPICNNCRKGNRPCPGYGPGVKFQDEGPKLREKYRKVQQQSTLLEPDDDTLTWALTPVSKETSSPGTPQSAEWNMIGLDIDENILSSGLKFLDLVEGKTKVYLSQDFLELMGQDDFLRQSDILSTSSKQWPPQLSMPMYSPEVQQQQLLAGFTASMIPPEAKFLPKALRAQGTWLAHLPGLSGASLLLDTAIRAVTLVHIGRMHNNDVFLVESRIYYGKALRLLATAISDEELGMDNKTLCATILLSFYEMFSSSDDAAWVRHAGGAGTLMRMRGAKRHRYGFDRDIFMAYRHTLVIEAMSLDVPSFLAEPEWRQLSKDIYNDMIESNIIPPERKEMFDVAEEFYSHMAVISVSSAKAYHLDLKIIDTGVVDEVLVLQVLRQLQAENDVLRKLLQRWKEALTFVGRWPSLVPVDDLVMPHQYHYSNVFIASLNIGLWTTLMLTNSHIYHMLTALGLPAATYVADNEEYAGEACRSVDFMIGSSFLGPFLTIYALRYVFRVFHEGDIRKDWALCKLIEIGDRRMLFAKGAMGGSTDGGSDRPEDFLEGAQRRLAEYNFIHSLR